MHRLELKALAAAHGHKPDRIHVEGRGWNLTQIALFREQHKLADAIEGALNRKAKSDRAMVAQEIQELPDRYVAHPCRNRGGARHGAADIGAIEQIGRQAWRPPRAFDDGIKVYIEFPSGIRQGEMPPLFIVGAGGDTELVNYRARQNYYIVDRLLAPPNCGSATATASAASASSAPTEDAGHDRWNAECTGRHAGLASAA
jgi:type IV secretory pathway VirB9-like protein